MYDQLVPAFKELFDKVEEHALHILLEPWTLLVSRDEQSFQTVSTVSFSCSARGKQHATDSTEERSGKMSQC